MNKIKATIFLVFTALTLNFVNAQTINDGVKFMYYEKYISAKNVFQKLLDANPNNDEAAYYLGQALIKTDDVNAAKALYLKALAANSNSALLTAAVGHIELLDGKTQDARNHFEVAQSLSKSKSVAVLNAIGLANGDFDNKNGDAAYAIEKLKLATTIKGFKDPETYCLLGDAYRKFADGGNAQTAYESALAIDKNYARAKYRIGKIYQTQGITQKDIYMRYYDEAIALDPNYGLVYYNLYSLFYNTDVVKSGEYLDKYLNVMGNDEPQSCYLKATMKYAQALNVDAIAQAKQCIAASANPYPKLFGLLGISYYKLNDSVNAKAAFEQYFKASKPTNIGATELETYGKILLKFPGNDSLASTYFDKAVSIDTTEIDKVTILKSIGSYYENKNQYALAANWYNKILSIRAMPTRTDIFNAGYNYYKGGMYTNAASALSKFTQLYPTDEMGWYWTAKTQANIDTSMIQGLANNAYQKVIDIDEAQWTTDSVKVKNHLLASYKYFISYSYNVKKDPKAALDFCNKYLQKEPSDAEVLNYQKVFATMSSKTPIPKKP